MTPVKKAYSGRLVFDHLPKTAGMAIHAWLVSELGTGCVTPNLVGEHSELIRKYGGLYSVISAHVQFENGGGLDPRYQYITLFRDPVDRVVSWLFYVINNFDDSELPFLRKEVIKFMNNEDALLSRYIENAYVEHFCRIEGDGSESEEKKISNALSVIKKYDVVGLYDHMPYFLDEVAALVDLPSPKTLRSVNVTRKRPRLDSMESALQERIIAMNQLDIRLFKEVVSWKESILAREPIENQATIVSPWKKIDKIQEKNTFSPDLLVSSASVREGENIEHGHVITIDMDISLKREISDLEMGFHIKDTDGKCAFGIDSTFLGQKYSSVKPGYYRISFHAIANLPAGKYKVGFSFSEKLPQETTELYWREGMCGFEVLRPSNKSFLGHSYIPSGISLSRTKPPRTDTKVTHHAGRLRLIQPLNNLAIGEIASVDVEIINCSNQTWVGDKIMPINLSYHWLDAIGNVILFDGLRTAIPTRGIIPDSPCQTEMQIKAPDAVGTYILILTLVQEMVGWFEEKGFEPARQTVEVKAYHV